MPTDKIYHLIMGAMASVTLYGLHHLSIGVSIFVGCAVFGVFYELQQWYRKEGTPDIWDAVATAAPGFFAYAIIEQLQHKGLI